MRSIIVCLLVSLLAAAAPEPTVSVLELHGTALMQPGTPPAYVNVLAEHGINVNFAGTGMHDELAWDRLKQFDVLMIPHLPELEGINGPNADISTGHLHPLIRRYVEAGGAVLYIGQPILSQYIMHEETNTWLQPYDVQIEWAIVDDPAHAYTNPPTLPFQRSQYLWSTNIAKHPITEGVRTIFWPNDMFYGPNMRPLKPGQEWTVLLRAMPGATVCPLSHPPLNTRPDRLEDQTRQEAAPLLAVRQFGKGRMAIMAADPGPFWFDLGKPAMGAICSEAGDGERTPDWLPLLRNLCVWLSESARQSAEVGGDQPPATFVVRPDYGTRDPIDWEAPDLALSDEQIQTILGLHSGWTPADFRDLVAGRFTAWKFLVGARTALSGGKGSVADWKAAARAEGFAGVIFREDILALSKEQWDAFEAECKAACDDSFLAIPGQQYTEWEGNTFMRFNQHLKYPTRERLTDDGTRVRDQLAFHFDAGRPANFPLFVRGNSTPPWSYRVHYAWPIALYNADGSQREENVGTWEWQVNHFQYPTPLGVHLLDDPAQVAGTGDDVNFYVLARTLGEIATSRRYSRGLGVGEHNSMAAFAGNGPIIEAALPLNMYRATLGARGVPGSYRWRFFIRASSDAPITAVELWGDGQLLRRYQPNSTRALVAIDEIHDRQRGLFVRVVDAKGREARGTSFMVHDKLSTFYWCGDQCNTLPYGQGADENGNAAGYGVTTHVRLKYSGGAGPGASFYDAWRYIPYGTDTSIPGLGIYGRIMFTTPAGYYPDDKLMHLAPNNNFWYNSRDAMIQREYIDYYADRTKYTNEYYGHGYLSAWGRYFRMLPMDVFTAVHDDVDLHRDGGQPGFQYCRGTIRFLAPLTARDGDGPNLQLGQVSNKREGLRLPDRVVGKGERVATTLAPGQWLTFPDSMGNGTVFALDDTFSVSGGVGGNLHTQARWGYDFGDRTFQPGDEITYRYLIMGWPVGMPADAGLDAEVSRALNLGGPGGVTVTALRGTVANCQLTQDLVADEHLFRGRLEPYDVNLRVPVRIRGINPNWAAGIWYTGKEFFEPVAPDPDGWSWASMDPRTEAGDFLFGNLLVASNDAVILRLLQRSDGAWDVVVHNPTGKPVRIQVVGTADGPVAGFDERLRLAPGEERRFTVR